MTDKQLRKLNRRSLLMLLLEQSKLVESLKAENQELRDQLASRDLICSQVGSLAEAALQVNRIFEDAQTAADQYLHNVLKQVEQQEQACRKREEESREQALLLLQRAKQKCDAMEAEARQKYGQAQVNADSELRGGGYGK